MAAEKKVTAKKLVKKKIFLVTGASGFIAKHCIVRLLKEGYAVHILAIFDKTVRLIKPVLGKHEKTSNKRLREELGIKPRTLKKNDTKHGRNHGRVRGGEAENALEPVLNDDRPQAVVQTNQRFRLPRRKMQSL